MDKILAWGGWGWFKSNELKINRQRRVWRLRPIPGKFARYEARGLGSNRVLWDSSHSVYRRNADRE